jgi:hypothetical protein
MKFETLEKISFICVVFSITVLTTLGLIYVPYVNNTITAIIFVLVCLTMSTVIFLIRQLCLSCLLRYLLDQLRREQEQSENVIHMLALDIQGEDCPICMDELNECIMLDCGHTFHTDCMNKWLGQQAPAATCPLCRDNLLMYPSSV